MAADKNRLTLRRYTSMPGGQYPTLPLVVFMILPLMAIAEPEIRVNHVYYMVEGNTAENIQADINRKSPVQNNGRRHAAHTRWHVSWKFWWTDNGSSCEISKVTTRLDVVYTLPRLNKSSAMPEPVLARWDKFNTALFSHEQGHKQLGVMAAKEIEDNILSIGPGNNCTVLELDANTIARKVIEKYSLIEKEYDRSTNHGLNTGAVLP
jgi:predicted secreted Zn-dependent protease